MKRPTRLSIAGLMSIVLVCSLGLAALRSASATWAGGLYLLTNGILVLAVIGAICRASSERAWWLGFALFGLGYLRGPFLFGYSRVKLPTTSLLDLMKPDGVKSFEELRVTFGDSSDYYWVIGRCLWCLLAAMIGGVLAHALFGSSTVRSSDLDASTRAEDSTAKLKWRGVATIVLTGLVAITTTILIIPRLDLALWAGTVYLLTWFVLGFAALGFLCGQGQRRMIWLGAAFFGLGYMVLNRGPDGFEETSYVHLVADEFLETLRPWLTRVVGGFPAETVAAATENARIKKILAQPLPMQFPEPTPLKDVLKYVVTATETSDGREIPIYVDPQGLQDADKTMQSTIQIDLDNSSLSTTLRLALGQLSLIYHVRDGILTITSVASDQPPIGVDYYLLLGHSLLAMLSSGLGACLAYFVSGPRVGEPTGNVNSTKLIAIENQHGR